jgi:hypothetical protein
VGVESTLFALLMSIFNAASLVSSETGALLTKAFHVTADNFDGLAPLVATCNVLGLLPLLFIDRLLDGAAAGSEDDQDNP